MEKILLIDDDVQIGRRLQDYFLTFDLELHYEAHPKQGIARIEKELFDLIILDIMMPEIDGLQLCQQIRRSSNHLHNIPILILSARGEVMDRVVGIEMGADDYLPKPFEPRELVVRIQAILKRSKTTIRTKQATEYKILNFGDLEINTEYRNVKIMDKEIDLTTKEYNLLEILAKSPNKNFSRDEILNHLQGIDADLYTRSVDILISRLRSKLKPTNHIKTVWGSGYSFVGEINATIS